MTSQIHMGSNKEYSHLCSLVNTTCFNDIQKDPEKIPSQIHHLKLFLTYTVTLYPLWDVVKKAASAIKNVLALTSEIFGNQDSQNIKYRALRFVVLDPLHILAKATQQLIRYAGTFAGIFSPSLCVETWKAAEFLEEQVLALKLKTWNNFAIANENQNDSAEKKVKYKKIAPCSYALYVSDISLKTLWNPQSAFYKQSVSPVVVDNLYRLMSLHPFQPPLRRDYDVLSFHEARIKYIQGTLDQLNNIPVKNNSNANIFEIFESIIGLSNSSSHSDIGDFAEKIDSSVPISEEEVVNMLPSIVSALPEAHGATIEAAVNNIKKDLVVNSGLGIFVRK